MERFRIDEIILRLNHPAGVYMISGIESNAHYIGSSTNIKKRLVQHEMSLRSGSHANRNMQKDYNAGVNFTACVLRFLVSPTHDKLLNCEHDEIVKAKNQNLTLYNIADFVGRKQSDYRRRIIEAFADRYCKEKYGKSLHVFLNVNSAKLEMISNTLSSPEKENELAELYADSISVENKINYYSKFGIDYELCVIRSELNNTDINTELKKEMKEKNKLQVPGKIINIS